MTPGTGWTVEFYVDADGSKPVLAFLRSLDDKAQARIGRAIEELKARNVQAREPLVKKIRGKVWELRIEINKNAYRILYFTLIGQRIVFLHAFQKKTQKTPAGDIDIAERRMADRLTLEEKDRER